MRRGSRWSMGRWSIGGGPVVDGPVVDAAGGPVVDGPVVDGPAAPALSVESLRLFRVALDSEDPDERASARALATAAGLRISRDLTQN